MWVTSGSHPDCSVGQWVKWVTEQAQLAFNPNLKIVKFIEEIRFQGS